MAEVYLINQSFNFTENYFSKINMVKTQKFWPQKKLNHENRKSRINGNPRLERQPYG